ncbi:MAG: hypothetical protein ABIJ17_01865 [Patescibacteria group bacterium]
MIVDRLQQFKNLPKTEFEKELYEILLKFSLDINNFTKFAFEPNIEVVTTSKTADNKNIYLVNCASGVVTITLPYASRCKKSIYWIKKIDASANNLIIQPSGTETIEGNLNITTGTQYKGYCLVSDLSNWFLIGDI